MKVPKVIIAGGSCFLGRQLATTLELDGWQVTILRRILERYSGHGTALA
jgi:nucleoside-diphosphate-sugar epimerase